MKSNILLGWDKSVVVLVCFLFFLFLFFFFSYFKLFGILSISASVHKAEFLEVFGVLWRTKFWRQSTNVYAWLFNLFKRSRIFHHIKFPWSWFVFKASVIFLEMSVLVLCHTFTDNSWTFHIIPIFCHSPCTQSFFLFFCFFQVAWNGSNCNFLLLIIKCVE